MSSGTSLRERHGEAVIADPPGHRIFAIRQQRRSVGEDGERRGLARPRRRGSPWPRPRRRRGRWRPSARHPSRTGSAGCTAPPHRAARTPTGSASTKARATAQAVEQSVASHEADVGPRDTRREAEAADQGMSTPGDENPLHETVTRWVTRPGSIPASSRAPAGRCDGEGAGVLLVLLHPLPGRRVGLAGRRIAGRPGRRRTPRGRRYVASPRPRGGRSPRRCGPAPPSRRRTSGRARRLRTG